MLKRFTGIRGGSQVLLLILASAWVVFRSGTGLLANPEEGLLAARTWPQGTGDLATDFLADSPLNLLAVRLLALETPRSWYTLHLIATLVAIIAWACVAAFAAGPNQRWHASRWILLSPFAAILLAWVGSYDPFTLLAMALCCWGLLANAKWLIIVGSVLLGFQHFSQGLLALAALLLTLLALQGGIAGTLSWRTWLLAGGGLIAGKALLVVQRVAAGQGMDARGTWIDTYLGAWTISAANTLPLLVWSLYAGAWGIIAFQFAHLSTVRARLWLALALAIGIAAQLVSGDRPRVFVIVMLPSLAVLIAATLRECHKREWRIVLESLLWLGVPIIFWSSDVSNVRVIDSTLGSVRIFLGLP